MTRCMEPSQRGLPGSGGDVDHPDEAHATDECSTRQRLDSPLEDAAIVRGNDDSRRVLRLVGRAGVLGHGVRGSTGIRFAIGPFLKPMVADLDLDRGTFSLVIAVGLLVYGAFQPFVGRLIDGSAPARWWSPARSCWARPWWPRATSPVSGTSTSLTASSPRSGWPPPGRWSARPCISAGSRGGGRRRSRCSARPRWPA